MSKQIVKCDHILSAYGAGGLAGALRSAIEGVVCFSDHVEGTEDRSGYVVSADGGSPHKNAKARVLMQGYVEGQKRGRTYCEPVPNGKARGGKKKAITAKGTMDIRTKAKRKAAKRKVRAKKS